MALAKNKKNLKGLGMDYIEQMRAFEEWVLRNPWRLSRSAQALWCRLNSLSDRQDGSWEVAVEGTTLARLMGATEKTFFSARTELEDLGILKCRRGVKASPSRYELIKLYGEDGWMMGQKPINLTHDWELQNRQQSLEVDSRSLARQAV